MCTVDHHSPLTHAGYLIDVQLKSIAPDVIFSRLLANHREVGLSAEQVVQLLDISREYHAEQAELRAEFGRVSEQLEIKWGRVNEAEIIRREGLLEEHARVFRKAEESFFTHARRGHELLTDEQIEAAEAIYHSQKDRALTRLSASLDSAVAPTFRFRAVTDPAAEPAAAATATVRS